MHRTSTIFSLGTFCFFAMLPACSTSNNDVGSLERDGSATGGVSGTGGTGTGGTTGGVSGTGGTTSQVTGTGGATGGVSGTGGTTSAPLTCSYQGKTYAIGESFKDDCNTCTCGALGDTIVRCTVMACLGTGGSVAGTGGRLGSGGTTGAGGKTTVIDAAADGSDGGEASYCAPCLDEVAAKVYTCPPQRPVTEADLKTVCAGYLGTGQPKVTLSLGGCKPQLPLPGCNATGPDPTVDVLSATFLMSGVDCHYSRTTGLLVGQAVSGDSPHYCGDRAYVAMTSGVNNGWCRAGGSDVLTMSCGGGPSIDGGVDGTPSDGPVASACSACGADELCVGYYDGTCKAMYTSCNKVSAATRTSILVDHARCFSNAMGDEICGLRDGQHFWGCGDPACPAIGLTLLSDVNCYGP